MVGPDPGHLSEDLDPGLDLPEIGRDQREEIEIHEVAVTETAVRTGLLDQ